MCHFNYNDFNFQHLDQTSVPCPSGQTYIPNSHHQRHRHCRLDPYTPSTYWCHWWNRYYTSKLLRDWHYEIQVIHGSNQYGQIPPPFKINHTPDTSKQLSAVNMGIIKLGGEQKQHDRNNLLYKCQRNTESSIWNNLIMVFIKHVMSQNFPCGGRWEGQHKQNTRLASTKNLGRVTPIIPGAGTPPKSCPLIGRACYWSGWIRISTCSLQIFLIKYFLVSCTKIQHGHTVAFGTEN